MRRFVKPFLFVSLLCLSCATVTAQQGNDQPKTPNKREIELLLTQIDRAFDTYELAVQMESSELGESSGATKDHEVTVATKQVLAGFKQDPARFNSSFGFLLIINLDDASRNMAVCMAQASNGAMGYALTKKIDDAERLMHLSQTCLAASNLLYTVSENATQMFSDYLLASAHLQGKLADALNDCRERVKGCTKPH